MLCSLSENCASESGQPILQVWVNPAHVTKPSFHTAQHNQCYGPNRQRQRQRQRRRREKNGSLCNPSQILGSSCQPKSPLSLCALNLNSNTFLSLHNYSLPRTDQSLLAVIHSEIKYAQEADHHKTVEEIPDGFPFEIQDNPEVQTVTLIRDYQGQTIKVEVHMPDLVNGDNYNENEDDERINQSSTALVVTISKPGKPSLEFTCTAFADEISIDSLAVKNSEDSGDQLAYEGPDFHDLDENLQKSFHKYLEIRGIKPSMTNFLHEYMINKDSREYLMWLKNLKSFIAA